MPQEDDTTTKVYYALSSFSYLCAMVSSNSALQFVNYPTQVWKKITGGYILGKPS